MSAEKKPLLLMVTKSGKTGVESLEEDKLKEMISDIGYTCKGVGEEEMMSFVDQHRGEERADVVLVCGTDYNNLLGMGAMDWLGTSEFGSPLGNSPSRPKKRGSRVVQRSSSGAVTPSRQNSPRPQDIKSWRQSFFCFFGTEASQNPLLRWELFQRGCHMTSSDPASLLCVLDSIKWILEDPPSKRKKKIKCPWCGSLFADEERFCEHALLYHINDPPPSSSVCPICGKIAHEGLLWHILSTHKKKNPPKDKSNFRRKEDKGVTAPFLAKVVVVCQLEEDGRFLIVQNSNLGYRLPEGWVEEEETPSGAAHRLCLEEAGLDVKLTGIISFNYDPPTSTTPHTLLTTVFLASFPSPLPPPKSLPDSSSVGACWATGEVAVGAGGGGVVKEENRKWVEWVVEGKVVGDIGLLREGK